MPPLPSDLQLLETKTVICLSSCNLSTLFNFKRFSTLNKVINYVAYVIRFTKNCRLKNKEARSTGPLSYEERNLAKILIWRSVQQEQYGLEMARLVDGKSLPRESSLCKLNPFLCEQGLLRRNSRLINADLDYDTKFPVIIPSGHIARLLIRFQHIYLNHSGVDSVISSLQTKFWIIKARKVTKSVIISCVPCQRHNSRACNEIAAPLPRDRVNRAPAFSIVGVDYAGPLYSSEFPSKKLYILLFTCAIVRAIHLELTESLLTSDFILALRRFTSRRGVPIKLYSDNARTFTSAANQLPTHYGIHAPNWQFITPRSPWMGGWWERLIRSTKLALRKSLGKRSLSKTQLVTVLCEIEHSINSRPLTRLYDHPSQVGPLTPAHFLLEQPLGMQMPDDMVLPLTGMELVEKHTLRQHNLALFWRIWKENYITNLPPLVKSHKKGANVVVGDIVLIRDEPLVPRLQWPLARVVQLYPGSDGNVRSVDVRTSKGIVCRPIQKLHRLEVCELPNLNDSDIIEVPEAADHSLQPVERNNLPELTSNNDEDPMSTENNSRVTITRSGRSSKPPERLCF